MHKYFVNSFFYNIEILSIRFKYFSFQKFFLLSNHQFQAFLVSKTYIYKMYTRTKKLQKSLCPLAAGGGGDSGLRGRVC